MAHSVFDHTDYKAFIKAIAESRPRGFRKALSHAIHCQTAYVSQVLNGDYQFSLEQAHGITEFLGLSKNETRCFVLLVEIQRAGTPSLKRFLLEQLEELREKHQLITERIGVSSTLSEHHQIAYYSSWQYAAVHMAVTIPELRTRAAIARALRIPPRRLSAVLDFLVSVGLITHEDDSFLPGSTELHLPKDSQLIRHHHSNWRQQALEQLDLDQASENLHYSSVSSLSAVDAQRIKNLMTQAISDAVAVIKRSPEEQLFGICLDFFRVDS